MEFITLNNGVRMPLDGIGTFMLSPADAENAVEHALTHGYQLIDTANAYMNERAVGRGIKKSGVKREDVFLVTKLWPSVYESGMKAVDETLERLGVDYVDLLILHQPVGNYLAGYKTMEEAYRQGKGRSLGLSNFPEDRLQKVLDSCEIKPQMVQVEAHPYYTQTELKKLLAEHGMVLMAWYPLGHGDKALLEEETFKTLAAKYGKTTAQIILRWHTQVGNVVIPGSKNPSHIDDNLNIFDFVLTDDELAEIAKLDKNVRYYNMPIEQAEKMFTSMSPDFNAQP